MSNFAAHARLALHMEEPFLFPHITLFDVKQLSVASHLCGMARL